MTSSSFRGGLGGKGAVGPFRQNIISKTPELSEISGTASLTFEQSGDLKGNGDLAGSATLTFNQTGDLTALMAGSISGTATLSFGQSGALTGNGALAGTATLTLGQSGNLGGQGALIGTTTLVFSQSGNLRGQGALAGSAALAFGQSGTLTGTGTLSGTAALVFNATGDLIGEGAVETPVFKGGTLGFLNPRLRKRRKDEEEELEELERKPDFEIVKIGPSKAKIITGNVAPKIKRKPHKPNTDYLDKMSDRSRQAYEAKRRRMMAIDDEWLLMS